MRIKFQYALLPTINWIVNLFFWCCMLFLLLVVIQIFCFCSFKIPSDSMVPTLIPGDNIVVSKMIPGARLFNLFAALRDEEVEIKRMPGIRPVKHNDVLVFNFPHTGSWDTIHMDIRKYYVKRCIGLPGDTLVIDHSMYRIKGSDVSLGNREAQIRLSRQKDELLEEGVFRSFPYDSVSNWNIKNFGPLYIPKKDDRIVLTPENILLYRKLIAWERQTPEPVRPGDVYQFTHNYYFMAGDLVENSQDSRYWGLLPEDFIVGKAFFIWKSKMPGGSFKWDRFFKIIH